LRDSQIVARFAANPPLRRYVLYGDKGYQTGGCIVTPHKGINLTEAQAEVNARLGAVHVTVEWFFGMVVNLWQSVAFRHNQRIYLDACGSQHRVAVLLTNVHTCLRGGNAIAQAFDLAPPSLEEYLGLSE
jgi:hypothetical protein